MKDYIEDKLGRLDKYLEKSEDVRVNVIVKVNNHSQCVEVTIPLKSVILRTEDTQQDFYTAVDKAIDNTFLLNFTSYILLIKIKIINYTTCRRYLSGK